MIGFPSLASTSMEQGRLAARRRVRRAVRPRPGALPFGIYSIPEISFVGKTEEELTAAGVPYEVGISRYRELARGVDPRRHLRDAQAARLPRDRRLLGVHILGTGATELIHIGQSVIFLEGTIDYFVDAVFNYPTLAEAYKVAALDAANKIDTLTRLNA